jgi:hypothetical protein
MTGILVWLKSVLYCKCKYIRPIKAKALKMCEKREISG